MGEGRQVAWTQGGDRGGGEVEVLQGEENEVEVEVERKLWSKQGESG